VKGKGNINPRAGVWRSFFPFTITDKLFTKHRLQEGKGGRWLFNLLAFSYNEANLSITAIWLSLLFFKQISNYLPHLKTKSPCLFQHGLIFSPSLPFPRSRGYLRMGFSWERILGKRRQWKILSG
jgi:hypothetical protein